MFALWYLSLAVDELRKHYGWTFFDIFYKTNKTDTKAIDNKPANVPKAAEPAQPSVSKTTPKPAAVVQPAPAPTPVPPPAPIKKPETPPAAKAAPIFTPTPAPAPVPVTTTVAKPEVPSAPKQISAVEPPKPFSAPLIKPEATPVTPPSPQKSFERNINDSLDKKLMEASQTKENGENLRNNLKTATVDFLSGETNGHTPSKR